MSGSVFIWQEQEPSGKWGTIAAIVFPSLGATPLVTRSLEVAKNEFGALARLHHQSAGRPVRLSRYDYARELERYE